MKRGLVAASILSAVVGYTVALGINRGQAFGQQPPKTLAWEYKVERFHANGIYGAAEDDFTKQLNRLASDGWEYIGPIANWQPENGGNNPPLAGYVAFRRTKR